MQGKVYRLVWVQIKEYHRSLLTGGMFDFQRAPGGARF